VRAAQLAKRLEAMAAAKRPPWWRLQRYRRKKKARADIINAGQASRV
jgi:hypothetical protein